MEGFNRYCCDRCRPCGDSAMATGKADDEEAQQPISMIEEADPDVGQSARDEAGGSGGEVAGGSGESSDERPHTDAPPGRRRRDDKVGAIGEDDGLLTLKV